MILHVDMDAFYAAVEQRDNPSLAGKPVIIGGSATGRGVVSTASYEARVFGVHSAMPTSTAKRLCPQGIFLPCQMEKYAAEARKIREIFGEYTPLVEPLSLDEAFLDLRPCRRLFGPAEQVGRTIQQRIRRELRLDASVGVAPVKFVAKIASDLRKPQGFVVVEPGAVQQFLDPLPVERLWGVGAVAGDWLHSMEIRTVAQLRALPEERVAGWDKGGRRLWQLAHGIDDRSVTPDHQARQISHETTFPRDIDDPAVLRSVLMSLTDQVARRLRRNELYGRRVAIKVRFAPFRTTTRTRTLETPTHRTDQLWSAASQLLSQQLGRGGKVRLLGVSISGLQAEAVVQGSLFDEQGPEQDRQRQLDAATDDIRDKFGGLSLQRAESLHGAALRRRKSR